MDYVPSDDNPADVFTKPLKFLKFKKLIGLCGMKSLGRNPKALHGGSNRIRSNDSGAKPLMSLRPLSLVGAVSII